jgi:uncharacterized protein YwgA
MITQVRRVFLNDALFALYAAHELGWSHLNRTNFQKILYFCAALSPLVDVEWGYEFTNAPYGPFNSEVSQAPDRLVVRYGYAEVVNVTVQKDSKMRADYQITERGKQQVERITKLKRERKRADWIFLVIKILDIYGSRIITKLAYREPTFSKVRKQNQKTINLSVNENRSIELLDELAAELEREHSITLDTLASKVIVYFDFLSSDIGRGAEV